MQSIRERLAKVDIVLEVTNVVITTALACYLFFRIACGGTMVGIAFSCLWASIVANCLGATAVLRPNGCRLNYVTAVAGMTGSLLCVFYLGVMILKEYGEGAPIFNVGDYYACKVTANAYFVFGIVSSTALTVKHYKRWDIFMRNNASTERRVAAQRGVIAWSHCMAIRRGYPH